MMRPSAFAIIPGCMLFADPVAAQSVDKNAIYAAAKSFALRIRVSGLDDGRVDRHFSSAVPLSAAKDLLPPRPAGERKVDRP